MKKTKDRNFRLIHQVRELFSAKIKQQIRIKSKVHGFLGLVLAGLLLYFSGTYYLDATQVSNYPDFLAPNETSQDPLTHFHKDFTLDAEFETNLPIVIIDTGNSMPPVSMETNAAGNGLTSLNGVKPAVSGTLSIIDDGGTNTLSDTPDQTSPITIERNGNAAMFYKKPQYLIHLISEDGTEQTQSILAMGAESEWVLNGSMVDKSMLRNYLAYSLSAKIMPFIPDNTYCEVIFKNGETYTYQGVYLLGENVKQGVNRVNIEAYNPEIANFGYLVKRDQINDQEQMLPTDETAKTDSCFSLVYPQADQASEATKDFVSADLNRIEKILYSDDYFEFSSYSDYIDVDSFVDYFLINEYFGNYSAGEYSTYLYKEPGGKLKIGPIWDFERAMDNYQREGFNTEFTAFQLKPWFDRLMMDKTFVKKLEARYATLDKGVFAEENVISQIDEIKNYLGDAQKREWYRWVQIDANTNRYSLEPSIDSDNEILYRELTSYDQELYRIKTVLRNHGEAIGASLVQMESSAKWESGMVRSLSVVLPSIVLFGVIMVFYLKKR